MIFTIYRHFKKIILILLSIVQLNYLAQDSIRAPQIYQLDDIIVSSDKHKSTLIDLPTKIDILSENEIKSSNGSRLTDILRNSTNIFVKSYGLTPSLSTISINGLGPEHTLVTIDGVRINSFQNSNVDLSLVSKLNIGRIELLNGGASSIYGSEAVGGVINIVLKNREDLSMGRTTKYKASASAGSFSTLGYQLNFYKEREQFNFGVVFSKESSNGDYAYHFFDGSKNILKRRENSAYTIYDVALNTQFILNENNRIKLVSFFSDQDKEVPGIEVGSPPPQTVQKDRNLNNILSIENQINSNLFVKSHLNYQINKMNYSVGNFMNSDYKNIVYAGGSELNWDQKIFGLTTGYTFAHAELISNELINGIQRNQHGLFISTYYDTFKFLRVYPAIRYDYISDIAKGIFTYKMGFSLKPIEDYKFSIKFNFGSNFRSPSFNDLYWKNSGNPNLESEHSSNFEAGLFYSFNYLVNGKIEFAYSQIDAKNKIVWIPGQNGFWSPENIGSSLSQNYSLTFKTEKEVNQNICIRLSSSAQLTYSKKTSENFQNDPTKDNYLPYVPLSSLNANLGLKYFFLDINLFYSRIGKRYTDYSNNIELPTVNILNANISTEFSFYEFESELKFEINNLTNSDYEIISGYPMALRHYKFIFTITY